jgi:hypothetical protein
MTVVRILAAALLTAAAQDPPAPPEKTTVSAILQTGHQKGQNLVWCSTFQLAWTSLGQDVCGEPLQLAGSPILERALNQGAASAKDLDPESIYVKAGKISRALIEEINAALVKRFGDAAPPPLQLPDAAEGALAVAYLAKTLAFARPFDRQREPLPWRGTEGEKTPLQAFGILKVDGQTPKELTSQIQILNDRRGEYIVELQTASPQDRLILAQTEPKATLQETLDDVRGRVRSSKTPPFAIQVTDQCLIPCVQVALERVYDEILGRKVLNAKLKDHVVAEARQSVRFALDEKGATVKSEAKILVPKNGHAPRRIVFDRPFLLYLERAGAENPYLAIWFENPHLFLKAESK